MSNLESVADWSVPTVRRYPEKAVRIIREMAASLDAALDVIENAPHDPECEQWDLQPQTGRPLTDVCTCWKATAL